ncbi:nuclease-related domain-containing protein [Planococcus chinensis]|uniref:Nuclease-related domain-containing protein n=1 Tax=Planococcus chinensis TaxID=272917 RepID=A0ABW4QEE5_9BACL
MTLSRVEALRSAIRRLQTGSPERDYLVKELYNAEAGIRGEHRLKKKFIEFYFPEGFEMIWNNCLALGDWPVQIDGFLLTKSVAVIIESKNISGELHFDNDTGEFYRIDKDGVKKVMDNPAIQVEKHIRFMKSWFKLHHINLAVDGLLVFTAKECELKTLPQTIRTCKLHQMMEQIFLLLKEYNSPMYSQSSLVNIKNLILASQTPYVEKPITLQYSIKPEHLAKGIYCTQCEKFAVKRHFRTWGCNLCGAMDNEAAYKAVLEYFAFFSRHASNRQVRDFTGIDDRHTMKRLLTQAHIEASGRKWHSKDHLKQ